MRRFIFFILLVSIPFILTAQDIDITKADFSGAVLSIAGPDMIYIRGMVIEGAPVSILIRADDPEGNRWKLADVFTGGQDYSPESLSLEFASVKALSAGEVEISGIFLGGKPYSAGFSLLPPDTAEISRLLAPGKLDDDFNGKVSRVFGTLVTDEIAKYEARIADLEKAVRDGETSLADLSAKNRDLQVELVKLGDDITAKDGRISSLTKDLAALQAAAENTEGTNMSLDLAVDDVSRKLKETEDAKTALEKRAGELESRLDELNLQKTASEKQTEDVRQQLQEANLQKNDLERQLQEADRKFQNAALEKTDLEKQVADLKEKQQAAAAAPAGRQPQQAVPPSSTAGFSKDAFKTTIMSGFVQTVPQLGSWEVTKNTAVQTDGNQFFAKLIVPMLQEKKRTLYSFDARSTGKGWIGLGLHIFAATKDKLKGYGFGNSLLIWVTRDQNYYGSPETHLQVYRSDDAVQMEQVLDCLIEEPVTSFLPIDVFYDPLKEYVSILVNGEHKLTYKTWFGIENGVEMALRTLGPGCEFRNLTVKREN